MKTKTLSIIAAAAGVIPAFAAEEKPDTARVFYFGNSLTGSSMPDFHGELGKNIARTRDYTNQVFEGVKKNFPKLWEERRLVRIPGGELFFELDKKMQAGEMPGVATIEDFYTDVQHIRAGMAAYSIAALFFAAIFEEKPDALDFTIYTDAANYPLDAHHDQGEVLPIVPERAKVLHETIWEVLQNHPHTRLMGKP